MVLFSERKELAEKYERWVQEYGAMNCPLSVITYLESNGFLKEDKIKHFLNNNRQQREVRYDSIGKINI